MALITVSAIFLRWLPTHGLPILVLFAVAVVAAGAIYVTQRRRYRANALGISMERLEADVAAVLWTALACVALGGLGLAIVATG